MEQTIEELPKKDVKIIIGDWNAKVGPHGYGERNDRGERLLEFASQNELFITYTRFQQKDIRKWTWMTPDGTHECDWSGDGEQ